MVRWRRK